MQIVIVTGVSGAGKSTALQRARQDIEFYTGRRMPNIPVLPGRRRWSITSRTKEIADKLAIAIDSRQRRNLGDWPADAVAACAAPAIASR